MPYAVAADMVAQLGEREVIALTDRNGDGAIDAAVLDDALVKAGVEIDSYLVGRYSLPLVGSFPLLTIYCCDIARYRLSGAEVTEVETARNRYKDALRFLESVRDGKIKLGPDASGQAAAESKRIVVVDGGARVFDRNTLSGFTG